MTTKQQNIIHAASELFSKDGYHATSTSKIAQKANVSEGLIFRHFKNKDGLVDVIISQAEVTISQLFTSILEEENSKQIIKKVLEFPFLIDDSRLEFWQLLYKLKWERGQDNSKLIKPIKTILIHAFTQLKYRKPKLESELVIHIFESVLSSRLLGNLENKNVQKEFLLQKYHF